MITTVNSRAFYGWLAHCRHLKTVRQHLSGLAFHELADVQNCDWSNGLKEDYWNRYLELVETRSTIITGNSKGGNEVLSCRNRPLKISIPAEHEPKIAMAEEAAVDGNEDNSIGNVEKTPDTKIDEKDEPNIDETDIYRRIYHGGIEDKIRSQVVANHMKIGNTIVVS